MAPKRKRGTEVITTTKRFKPTAFSRAKASKRRSTSLNAELKFLDTAHSFTTDATLEIPATGQINLVPQDDTQSGRDGRKIVIKSIFTRLQMTLKPAADALAADVMYLWLVQDKQCNGGAATVGDANTGIFTTTNAVTCQLTLANSSRFKILKKWSWPFNPSAGVTTAYNNYTRNMSYYMKCEIPIEFDASAITGAIGTIRSNNLFFVCGTNTNETDDKIVVLGSTRIRYADH